VCFRRTVKTCKARIETNNVIFIAEYGDHDHSDKVRNVAAVALRVSCKRRAAKDISQRPPIPRMTDTDDADAALLELQVAVLLIPHLRFC